MKRGSPDMKIHEPYDKTGCVLSRFVLILSTFLLVTVCACSDKTESPPVETDKAALESFSFFDVGADSRFRDDLRDNLRDNLGTDAFEARMPIDLSINYPEFLDRHFPDLAALNRKLNYRPQERIEHNTVKLTYRNSRKKGRPFDLITIVFSNYSKKPLLIDITAKNNDLDLIGALENKYGTPENIQWDNGRGSSKAWTRHSDVLIASSSFTRIGKPVTRINIYFVQNIIPLIEQEEKERQELELKRKKAGESAF